MAVQTPDLGVADNDIFNAAMSAETPEAESTEAAAQPVATEEQPHGQPRDENGRFASTQAQQEAQPQQTQEQPAQAQQQAEAHVPSWRLREEREAREAAERRVGEIERSTQRQIAELMRRLPQQETQPRPDIFDKPDEFVEYGVRQQVDPIKSEFTQMREFYSRKDAVREHGAEKVQAAYSAIAKGMQERDPEVMAIYQRAMSGMDPYGDIVSWHQQKSVYQTIGADPNAWWEQRLEEQMKDPAFQAKVLQTIQKSAQANQGQQGTPKIQLPPSISRIGSGASLSDDDGDMSDGALFRQAMR